MAEKCRSDSPLSSPGNGTVVRLFRARTSSAVAAMAAYAASSGLSSVATAAVAAGAETAAATVAGVSALSTAFRISAATCASVMEPMAAT